jgi:hypothetical protein
VRSWDVCSYFIEQARYQKGFVVHEIEASMWNRIILFSCVTFPVFCLPVITTLLHLPTNLQWTLLCVVNIINIQVSFSHSLFCFLLVDIIVPKTYQITNINHDPFINNMSTKTKVWTNPKSQTILLWNFVCLSTLTQ